MESKENQNSHYTAVDLGLPSGTLWCNKNIGAKSETDYGLYFQWGDTVGYTSDPFGNGNGKKEFYWDDYKYIDDSYDTLTKYCNESSHGEDGFTDNLPILESSDDAATVNMGKKWRIPTQEEFYELISKTNHEWTIINGVCGYKFTNKTDSSKYVFFPAAGGLWDGTANEVGEYGGYWSSSLDKDDCYNAWCFNFDADNVGKSYGRRYVGYPVRGVLAK